MRTARHEPQPDIGVSGEERFNGTGVHTSSRIKRFSPAAADLAAVVPDLAEQLLHRTEPPFRTDEAQQLYPQPTTVEVALEAEDIGLQQTAPAVDGRQPRFDMASYMRPSTSTREA